MMGFALVQRGFRQGIALLAAGHMMVLALLIAGLVPLVDKAMQQPLRGLADYIKTHHASGMGVYHMGLHVPSVRLHSAVPFRGIDAPAQLPERVTEPQALILTEAHRVHEVTDALPNYTLTEQACRAAWCVVMVEKTTG
jgi:hypothetical protein